MGKVDLHVHTTASDGMHRPAEVVRMAERERLAGLAITDHDTVAGVEEAMREGEAAGIVVVPGVEISTVSDGKDVHVLGYDVDWQDPVFLRRLHSIRDVREKRNAMIIERLRELGVPVTMAEVKQIAERSHPDGTIGRPHIAEAMLRKGYVSSISEAFDRYLGRTGTAYVNPPRISPEEAIDWIHDAGGVAVLAHPALIGDDALVRRLIDCGFDGIEAFHADHTHEDEAMYAEAAVRRGLIVTAGSDFHGARGGERFHAPLGAKTIGIGVLERLKAVKGKEIKM